MRLRSETPVTLLGPGDVSPEYVEEILARAPFLVAADGGARSALRIGRVPEAVIGDFDSLPEDLRISLPQSILHRIPEQETTDFEKCLSRIEAPLTIALGFTGRRLDHELAVYNALARHPGVRCIVVGSHDLVFMAPREITLAVAEGTRVSLFPLAPVRGDSEGLRWPLSGIDFRPDGRVGTSNAATGPVRLRFDAPGMLVILPRAELPAAMAALAPG